MTHDVSSLHLISPSDASMVTIAFDLRYRVAIAPTKTRLPKHLKGDPRVPMPQISDDPSHSAEYFNLDRLWRLLQRWWRSKVDNDTFTYLSMPKKLFSGASNPSLLIQFG